MQRNHCLTGFALALLAVLGGLLWRPAVRGAAVGGVAARQHPELRIEQDPAKVVGSDTCIKCHAEEAAVWHGTPHFATFDTLHRTPQAKEIAKRMGERSIKRGAICVKCHYTEQEVGGRTEATSGVSCESCHGPARDWIALHNDYGGPGVTKASESPQHAQLRRARSVAAGMRNPHNLYLVARSCFNCHTAPNESLVERGGHPTGSPDFELVAWSQGRVRHNFLRTGGVGNAAEDRARLRVMYVVGQLTDLEYSLRALAAATLKANYGKAAALRSAAARKRLAEMQLHLADPRIQVALDAFAAAPLAAERREQLTALADRVSEAAYQFADEVDGASLAAIDGFLPSVDEYK